MFRLLTLTLLVFGQLFQYGQSWNLTEYARFVEELSVNTRFRDEFEKRTAELFKDPEYENGPKPPPFPCTTEGMKSATVPTSVHALLPGDIQCVAAMGDSLTAAMGAKAKTVVGVLGENRGISWSIGGDKDYNDVLTLPNILRLYNPSLKGYSTKTSISIFNGQNAKNNGLNVAKSGARSYHMREQAELLIERIKSGKWCNWENDWKLVTFFIGGNDLCSFCDDLGKHNPIQFTSYVKEALDTLYNANLPRTLINVVLVLDVRSVRELNAGGFVCELLHTAVCNCAAFPTGDDEVILNQWVSDYQGNVTQLIKSGIYDKRDDFTVVVQPFFSHTVLPRTGNNVDFSYFAPDCFHFSAKGHAASALSLWNNMFEPVGTKRDSWHLGEEFKCPPADHPYIFTSKN